MMKLSNIIRDLPGVRHQQVKADSEITSITHDSRSVSKGSLFIALNGLTVDGHHFIDQAIGAGATAIIYDDDQVQISGAEAILVQNSRLALPLVAANFYDHPEAKLSLIGITGTNGKTTSNYFLQHLMNASGRPTGRIGTTGADFHDLTIDLIHTTPESSDLYAILDTFFQNGAESATLEVSSHALAQNRVDGLSFKLAIFSNLTQDHLDYHESFEEYIAAKRLLFSNLHQDAVALVNADDPNADAMLTSCPASVVSYGQSEKADYRIEAYRVSDIGTHVELNTPQGSVHIETNTVGLFNIYNLVSAFSAALELDVDKNALLQAAKNLPVVPGRLELMQNHAPFKVFVDYAHTPDAMSTVLSTLAEAYPSRKLITVFGCGGDRDKGKRPIMGEIATRLSTFSIITDDNPRTEAPLDIIHAIADGCQGRMNYIVIQDRATAVANALDRAEPGDIIAILGKGHEPYQEIMGERKPYSDMKVIDQFMEQNGYTG